MCTYCDDNDNYFFILKDPTLLEEFMYHGIQEKHQTKCDFYVFVIDHSLDDKIKDHFDEFLNDLVHENNPFCKNDFVKTFFRKDRNCDHIYHDDDGFVD